MFGLFESYNRRRLRDVRRQLREVVEFVERAGRSDRHKPGHPRPPSPLADQFGALRADLSTLEPIVDRPTTDIIYYTSVLRTSFRYLKREAMQLDRRLRQRYPSLNPKRSPFPPLFERLDKLEDAISRLYGPPTKFQSQLKKLIKNSGITMFRLAKLSRVDETYIRRLIRGEKRNPGEGTVAALALGFREYSSKISVRDFNRLIKSSGYEPPTADELEEAERTPISDVANPGSLPFTPQ